MPRAIFPLLLLITGCFYFISCKKAETSGPDPLIANAESYFKGALSMALPESPDSNFRFIGKRTADWLHARVIHLPGPGIDAVVVPVVYENNLYLGTKAGGNKLFPVNNLAQLLIFTDAQKNYHAQMITMLPDSSYTGRAGSAFSGFLLVDQWNGEPIARFRYGHGLPLVWCPGSKSNTVSTDVTVESCEELVGYNYAPGDPSASYSYTETLGCSESYLPDQVANSGSTVAGSELLDGASYDATVPGGIGVLNLQSIYPGPGGIALGGIVDGTALVFVFDSTAKAKLQAMLNCFSYVPDQGATYSVTLCTDLPVNNNPGALLAGNLHPGHAFLILTKTNGVISYSQSFGFYPVNGNLSALNLYVASEIKDDGATDHEYNASIAMPNISQLDFQTVENEAMNLASSQLYNLTSFNCTDYALEVFNSIRPNDPIAIQPWIGVYTGINFGATPNALYEQMVSMEFLPGGLENPNVQIGVMHAPASPGPCN